MIFYFGGINAHPVRSEDVLPCFKVAYCSSVL